MTSYRTVLGTLLILLLGLLFSSAHGTHAQSHPPVSTLAGIAHLAAPAICSPLGFSNNSYPVGGSPDGIALGDFNADGIADLVTANFSSDNVSVLLGNANGTFGNAVSYPAGYAPYTVAVADIFGDRLDDVVTGNGGADDVSVLQGNGDGTLTPPYHFTMGSQPYSLAIADFNNDGWPDLVTASASANDVTVRLGDGIGGFAPATHVLVSGGPHGVAVGDFNRDGRPDLVTADDHIGRVSVLLGNGDGSFQAPINFSVGTSPNSVAVGDLNGDGNLDLAVGNDGAASVSVLLGNGDGLFQTAQTFAVGSRPFGIALGDFNNDGHLDLVTANYGSTTVSVLLGNGDGTFQPQLDFAVGSAPDALAAGDFNRDGKLDLVTANLGSNSITVLLNTCLAAAGTPTPPPTATPRPPSPTQTPGGPTATPVPPTATGVPPIATSTFTPLPTQTPGGPTATPPPLPTICAIQFSDVPVGSTFYSYVRCLACRGIINGYSDGSFKPNSNVTRGQLSKFVSNAAGFSDAQPNQMFEDVPVGSTFQLFVGRLASRGYIGGYPCGGAGEPCVAPNNLPYFRPGNNATRGQIAKIDANAGGYSDPPAGQQFEDVGVGSTYYAYTYRLVSRGVMSGYPCGGVGEPCISPGNQPYFRPNSNATRGQTAKIVSGTFFPNCQTP